MATCDMMNNVYGSESGMIVLVWWYLLVLVFGFWSRIGFQERITGWYQFRLGTSEYRDCHLLR